MKINTNSEQNNNTYYEGKSLRFYTFDDHHELWWTDGFMAPGVGDDKGTIMTDIMKDLDHADKMLPLHIHIESYGGELDAIAMVAESVRRFPIRIGYVTGMAMSAGWILYMLCPVRYVSRQASLMYHHVAALSIGKTREIQVSVTHIDERFRTLIGMGDTNEVLTDEELKLGETSEVWLTGTQLIERGGALAYIPGCEPVITTETCYVCDGELYRYETGVFTKMAAASNIVQTSLDVTEPERTAADLVLDLLNKKKLTKDELSDLRSWAMIVTKGGEDYHRRKEDDHEARNHKE